MREYRYSEEYLRLEARLDAMATAIELLSKKIQILEDRLKSLEGDRE
mgnify:CR=1 FL=1